MLLIVARTPEDSFNTLGRDLPAPADSGRTILNIVFDESTPEAAIRSTLLDIGGSIDAGPSPRGRYQISVAGEPGGEGVLAELEDPGVIKFVSAAN